jgi:hypothetical protein
MKMNFFSKCLVLLLAANNLMAQDLTSKNGEVILPQAKDWCIGVDATKLIKNAKFDFAGGLQTITGKYFLDAKTAYRMGLRIGVNNVTTKNRTTDRVASTSSVIAYPSAKPTKENTWRRTSTVIGLSFGIEKRRGSTRLQGVYGIEGGLYVTSTKDKFTYGNKLNPVSTSAKVEVDSIGDALTSPVLGKAGNIVINPPIQGVNGSARATEVKSGRRISIGARAFIGAEYFVLPKLSVGGEFGWSMGYTLAGRSKTTLESVGQANIPNVTSSVEVRTTTIDGSSSSQFWLDNDQSNLIGGASASLKLNLYF